MSTAAGLETLHYHFAGTQTAGEFAPVLVGVVGSGNLEVLMEAIEGSNCRFEVQTSARGFGHIWEAVLRDFHASHPLAGVSIAIHDMGATPAVVGLRLAQAAAMR
jgi:malonate decarboxylase delta subunit